MSYHQPRKRFGQNFLRDTHVSDRIVAAIAPRPGEHLVEIGPGQGALTLPVLAEIKQLTAVELDRDLIAALQQRCDSVGQLTIYSGDALTFDFMQLAQDKPLRIFGNLPYNISTPLIFHLLDQASVIQDMYFMLQKEVVARLAAEPATAAYGRLSVMVQYACQVEFLFTVSAGSFYPPPKVESAIVRLIPYRTLPYVAADFALFSDIVRYAFMHRRKTLGNSLRAHIPTAVWSAVNIDPGLRAEQLSVEDYVRLSNHLKQ
jgi:16S rRNA (adenine1518-N6/adenine1519-N6)-dimethyltransferase